MQSLYIHINTKFVLYYFFILITVIKFYYNTIFTNAIGESNLIRTILPINGLKIV